MHFILEIIRHQIHSSFRLACCPDVFIWSRDPLNWEVTAPGVRLIGFTVLKLISLQPSQLPPLLPIPKTQTLCWCILSVYSSVKKKITLNFPTKGQLLKVTVSKLRWPIFPTLLVQSGWTLSGWGPLLLFGPWASWIIQSWWKVFRLCLVILFKKNPTINPSAPVKR